MPRLSQLKIIEYQNKILTDEINTNKDLEIPYLQNLNIIYI
jgi:hypothetical protein